jgi:hypothetical protein
MPLPRLPDLPFGENFLPDLAARAAETLTADFGRELRGRGATLAVWRVMTKRLDRVEAAGLVERHSDKRDRRAVQITLTPAGEAQAAELARVAEEFEEQIERQLPAAEEIKPLLREIIIRFGRTQRPKRDAASGGSTVLGIERDQPPRGVS